MDIDGDDKVLFQESLRTSSFKGYENEAGMVDAAYRAVSEGLKALHDDYLVTPEELGDPEVRAIACVGI